jgi:hypothetical protein
MQFRCLEKVPVACKDEVTLTPVFSVIRAHWYGALANLLYSEEVAPGRLACAEPHFYIPPLAVKKADKQMVAVIQKQLDIYEGVVSIEAKRPLRLFNNYKSNQELVWAEFKNVPYCIEWSQMFTHYGVYGFGYDWRSSSQIRKIASEFIGKKKKEGYQEPALCTMQLVQLLHEVNGWTKAATSIADQQQKEKNKKDKKIKVDSPRGRAIALWVRAIATLEVICKDTHCTIITRKGVYEDFSATVQLLERITLPRYFDIELDKPLFEDYSKVQPVIAWELLN